ncbi:hypothetical protein GA0115254_10797 [Streptomyces sp. Ncost-T10-10d]|nr:hypothetical protein GA0115254_10797 [Streptomyces sp. Ncost-T10-10d]
MREPAVAPFLNPRNPELLEVCNTPTLSHAARLA